MLDTRNVRSPALVFFTVNDDPTAVDVNVPEDAPQHGCTTTSEFVTSTVNDPLFVTVVAPPPRNKAPALHVTEPPLTQLENSTRLPPARRVLLPAAVVNRPVFS